MLSKYATTSNVRYMMKTCVMTTHRCMIVRKSLSSLIEMLIMSVLIWSQVPYIVSTCFSGRCVKLNIIMPWTCLLYFANCASISSSDAIVCKLSFQIMPLGELCMVLRLPGVLPDSVVLWPTPSAADRQRSSTDTDIEGRGYVSANNGV